MKKLLVLLLIFMLSFGTMGCGNSDDSLSDDSSEAGHQTDDDLDEGDLEDGDLGTFDIDDLILSDDEAEDSAEYDFGFKASTDFRISGAVEKVSYSDLSAHADTMESMLEAAAKKALNGEYVLFGDYEEDDEDSIDKLAYAMGLKDDDVESCYIEAGVYHNVTTDKYYQYIVYFSANYYEVSSENIKEAISELKSAFGITVSQSKIEEAVKQAIEEAKNGYDLFTLYQKKSIEGSGYTETVSLGVEAFISEDDETGFYISVERERCYN